MRKLEKDIYKKLLIIFTILWTLMLITIYISLKYFLFENLETAFENQNVLFSMYETIWMKLILFSFVLMGIFIYVLHKTRNKIYEELHALNEYLISISQKKDYYTVFKAQKYVEFLQVALHLKNIVKRLEQKQKKVKKKN